MNQYHIEWHKKNPLARIAHQIVQRAIKCGELIRPEVCENCNRSGKTEASHDDYNKPLEVQWLCVKCHREKDGVVEMLKDIGKKRIKEMG